MLKIFIKRMIVFILVNAMCCQSAFAEEKLLTLKEAIFLALRFNPEIQIGEIGRIAEKFNLLVEEDVFHWNYGLQGSARYTTSRVSGESINNYSTTLTPSATKNGIYGTTYALKLTNPISDGVYNPAITMEMTQPLMRGFGKDVTLAPLYSAEDQEMINRLRLKNTIIQTVATVIATYNALIQAYTRVEISEKTLEAYSITIDSIAANIKAGRRAATDILQAEANYASELVNLQIAKSSVITLKRDLMNLIGLSPDMKFTINLNLDLDTLLPAVPGKKAAFQVALENNVQYRSDLLALKQLRRALVVAKDNMRPLLNFSLQATSGSGSGGGFNSGLSSLTNGKNNNLTAELSLDFPIDDYVLKQGLINAQVGLSQAEINLRAEVRNLKTIIFNNIEDVKSSIEQIRLSKNAIALREKDQEHLNAKLQYGLTTVFEVTTKQQELAEALNRLVTDQITYINSMTVLYANMGILLGEWGIKINY